MPLRERRRSAFAPVRESAQIHYQENTMNLRSRQLLAVFTMVLSALFAHNANAVHPSFDDHPEHTTTTHP